MTILLRGQWSRFIFVVVLSTIGVSGLNAQARLTGAIAGNVEGPDGDPLPGVSVTATSEALQGSRVVIGGVNGDYLLQSLPAGTYSVVFALEGMTTVKQTVRVDLGLSSRADASLELREIEESIDVIAETPSALANDQVGINLTDEAADELPINREPISIANFSPGVSDRSEVPGQISVSGGIGYDNLIALDGVDIGFGIFGNASGPSIFPTEVGLFIEDAIDETQVLTGTISAEYGRFSGGVVNAVTKRGGNRLKGSVRVDMTNPSWREESSLQDRLGLRNESDRNDLFSATLGGYLVKDRLWFFAAGSDTSRSDPTTFAFSNAPRPNDLDNQRYELKLTGAINDRHTIEGVALENSSDLVFSIFGIDARTIDSASIDNDYLALRYTGVLGNKLLAEGRYSERQVRPQGLGGTGTDLRDSPFFGLNIPGIYNAPIFDEGDPSQSFDDETLAVVLSQFLATEALGSHDLRYGLERFDFTQFGGNSQSPTDYVFFVDPLFDIEGAPVFDDRGAYQPVFEPFNAFATLFFTDRDGRLEATTTSVFVNDVWRLNDHWSFNLGFRYEDVKVDATPGVEAADFDSLVPRLAATYSPGDGNYRVTLGYAEYKGRANSELFKIITSSRNSNNNFIDFLYAGPSGIGLDFAPGFDLGNYFPVSAASTSASSFAPGVKVPKSVELSVSFAMQLPRNGYLQASLIDRSFEDGFESFIEFGNGTTELTVDGTSFVTDNVVYRNTDLTEREYLALQIQGRYDLRPNLTLNGHWTWEIENDGNYVGENFGNPYAASPIGDYAEIFVADRNFPTGPLPSHLEHKLRIWSHYAVELGRPGDLDLTLLFRYDSPRTYSHTSFAPIFPQQIARDPGYAAPPFFQQIFFGGRGSQEFDDLSVFDFAGIYRIGIWQSLEPWIKLQVRNIFHSTPKRTFDTQIVPDFAGPVDANGIPTEFIRSPTYGQALSPDDLYPGREFLVSLGIRF